MRKSICFKYFINNLSENQKEEYRKMSIKKQKDWYIGYLESHYSVKPNINNEEADTIISLLNGAIDGLKVIKGM